MFKGAQNAKDPVFWDHSILWKKYLADINPGALEKCLDCLNAFIDRGDPKCVASCQNEVLKHLIEKCIQHAKPSIREKSKECFLLMFEVSEAFEESVDAMVEALGSKNIKVTHISSKVSRV